jgi:hypothetical protein
MVDPEDPERDSRWRNRHGTPAPGKLLRDGQATENALDDYYGGTANIDSPQDLDPTSHESYRPSQARASRPWTRARRQRLYTDSSFPEAGPADITDRYQEASRYRANEVIDEDALYLEEPPDRDWELARERVRGRRGSEEGWVVFTELSLVMARRGRRFKSKPFPYGIGWTDKRFAKELKYQYAHLKRQDVGLFQRIVAYKQIAYVIVLQARYSKFSGKWVVAKSVPITTKGDKEGRNAFMYLLRHPRDECRWTGTIDKLCKPGAILYLEIIETFDSSVIYAGILLAALLSLGVALAYGFTMDGDFSTGFSIASWLITAFGFFAALVSISEIAGMESFTSFQTGVGIEEAEDVPKDLEGGYY